MFGLCTCTYNQDWKNNFETEIAVINDPRTITENEYHSPSKQTLLK